MLKTAPFTLAAMAVLSAQMFIGGTPQACAQTLEQQGLRPVDQRVEDADPLARSLRHLKSDLAATGQGTIYKRQDDQNGQYYFISPGVVAEFDRPEYLTGQGQVMQGIPAGVRFHIGEVPPESAAGQASAPASPLMVDHMIRGRIDGNYFRIKETGPAGEGESEPGEADAQMSNRHLIWQRYAQVRAAQRTAVIRAMDEAMQDPDSPR